MDLLWAKQNAEGNDEVNACKLNYYIIKILKKKRSLSMLLFKVHWEWIRRGRGRHFTKRRGCERKWNQWGSHFLVIKYLSSATNDEAIFSFQVFRKIKWTHPLLLWMSVIQKNKFVYLCLSKLIIMFWMHWIFGITVIWWWIIK